MDKSIFENLKKERKEFAVVSVSVETHEKLKKLKKEYHISFGKIIDALVKKAIEDLNK